MKQSALVLVLLCLVNAYLCNRMNLKKQIGSRLTPPRFQGIKRLFHAFPGVKVIRPSELPTNRLGLKKPSQQAFSRQYSTKGQEPIPKEHGEQIPKEHGQKHSTKGQEEVHVPPARSMVEEVARTAAAATFGAAVGVGYSVDWDLNRLRGAIQYATTPQEDQEAPSPSELVTPPDSDTGRVLVQKDTGRGPQFHHPDVPSAPPSPPPPQEEAEGTTSQSQNDVELPPPGNWALEDGIFSIATERDQYIFKYTGDFESDGKQSDVAYVVREDGKKLIMKRPKYTQNHWDDNLHKECFVARYLNMVGASKSFANCMAERTFEPHEVAALKASQKRAQSKVEHGNNEKWHAILLEQVEGRSFMNTELSLSKVGRQDSDTHAAESKAVEQIITATGQMLKAGIVNVDQWHNILVNDEGEVKFIDFDGASFLSKAPLQVFLHKAAVGKDFKHETREMKASEGFGPVGKWEVTQNSPPKALSRDEAEQQVRKMITNIFGLVPPHAVAAAENTLKSREKLGNSLDDIVDQAWMKHKAAVKSRWMREIVSETKGNLDNLQILLSHDFADSEGEQPLGRLRRYLSTVTEDYLAIPPDHTTAAGDEARVHAAGLLAAEAAAEAAAA